jgi:ABC-type protease/lipase transport system fused ATPase/permease subunit
VASRFSSSSKLARQLIQIAMLAAGAWLVVDQQVTAGIMIAGTILLGRALAPVEMLVASWRPLVEAHGAWRRLARQLDAAPTAAATELPAPQGCIELERASFAVRPGERPILRGVSFRLEAGESLAIIGPSASGKSTLARLLAGVWRPVAGSVRLDGAEIADWPRARLDRTSATCRRTSSSFQVRSPRTSPVSAKPEAPAVIRAAQRAGVHEMILALSKGYDTDIGASGEALSGGQRQRIALARALYGAPRLVILDEPNSNLDEEGQAALLRAMQKLREEGVTLVLIAHRPSLLAGIDKLLVLREGVAEAFGARDEVLPRVTRAIRPKAVA